MQLSPFELLHVVLIDAISNLWVSLLVLWVMCPSGAAVLNYLWHSQPLPVDRVQGSLSSILTLPSAEVPALMGSVNISGAISRLIPNRPHGSRMSNAAFVMLSAVRWARGRERGMKKQRSEGKKDRRHEREGRPIVIQDESDEGERKYMFQLRGLFPLQGVWQVSPEAQWLRSVSGLRLEVRTKGYLLHRGTCTLLPHLTCLGIVP